MENISIAILCGGKSSRFKSDCIDLIKKEDEDEKNKLYHTIDGEPLYEINYRKFEDYTDDIFLQGMSIEGFTSYKDIFENRGPLGGILSALQNANHEKVLVIAADMPLLETALIDEFKKHLDHPIIVPRWNSGYLEPLCSVYSKSTSKYISKMLADQVLKVSKLYTYFQNIRYLNIQSLMKNKKITEDCFLNINTKDDLKKLEKNTGYLSNDISTWQNNVNISKTQ